MAIFLDFLAAVLVIVLAISVYASFQTTSVFELAVPYTPADFDLPYKEVHFKSSDGLTLIGWFIPASKPSDTTIIIQHGVGSNHGDTLLNTVCLSKEGGWNLFYYNFRGHAGSEGKVTSLGVLELRDLAGALTFLRETKPQETRHLGIYGHSLGGAVAILGAAEHPELEAVAAESPFASVRGTIAHFAGVFYGLPVFPFVWLSMQITALRLRVPYGNANPVEQIGKIAPRPIFIIYGDRDKRMPMSDFNALWAAAGDPKESWIAKGADHGDPWLLYRDEYESRLVGFFKKAFERGKNK